MKTLLTLILLGGFASVTASAQPGPPGGRGGGFPDMADPARRSEMMVQRLAEEVGLNKDQRKQVKEIMDHAQNSAKPLQQELQDTLKQIKDAVKSGKSAQDLESLHQKLGATYAKLAAVQSNAFADALKTLKEDQKEDSDAIYDTLSTVTGSGGRGGMRFGGFGGFGPPGFGGPGRGGPGRQGPPPGLDQEK